MEGLSELPHEELPLFLRGQGIQINDREARLTWGGRAGCRAAAEQCVNVERQTVGEQQTLVHVQKVDAADDLGQQFVFGDAANPVAQFDRHGLEQPHQCRHPAEGFLVLGGVFNGQVEQRFDRLAFRGTQVEVGEVGQRFGGKHLFAHGLLRRRAAQARVVAASGLTQSGTPTELPGVHTTTSAFAANSSRRIGGRPWAASSSSLPRMPRLAISPWGSTAMMGMPLRTNSSQRTLQVTVLPLPELPRQMT